MSEAERYDEQMRGKALRMTRGVLEVAPPESSGLANELGSILRKQSSDGPSDRVPPQDVQ
jgi:hypothetical protein